MFEIFGRMRRNLFNETYVSIYYYHKRIAYKKLAMTMGRNIGLDHAVVSSDVLREYKSKWSILDPHPDPYYFTLYSSFNNSIDLNYVPDYLYSFPIDCILSNMRYSAYTEHKALYQNRLPEFKGLFPKTYCCRICGTHYDSDYKRINEIDSILFNLHEREVVFKAALDTGSGRDVFLFRLNDKDNKYYSNEGHELCNLSRRYSDFVIQERLKQNEYMNEFNPSSVNTIRVR